VRNAKVASARRRPEIDPRRSPHGGGRRVLGNRYWSVKIAWRAGSLNGLGKQSVYLTRSAADETLTTGVELLSHIREAFGGESHIATVTLLERLRDRDVLSVALCAAPSGPVSQSAVQ